MKLSRITSKLHDCVHLLALVGELHDAWLYEKSKRWINRRWLCRPINKRRLSHGFFATQFQEMKCDPGLFFKYVRMDIETFNHLLSKVQPYLRPRKKKRDSISAEERLAMTLSYLATGDDILSIALLYRIGKSTAYKIIKETCSVLHQVLSPIYLRPPCTPVWRNISKGFEQDWQLPGCIGAVDGKHISIKSPPNSGSLFFNYKKFNSIVLLAACNHRYEFTIVNVGAYGSESDGGIFARSQFGKALNEGGLNIPSECAKLTNSNIKVPHFFVGDEAFRMTKNMMRPYPGRHLDKNKRIFNYRLSRARRCIENAFGIMVSRWRVLSRPIAFSPKDVDKIVLAIVCLHNFMMAGTQKSVRLIYCPSGYNDSESNNDGIINDFWRNEVQINNVSRNINSHEATQEAHRMRDILADYFSSPDGEVPWQEEYINRGKYQDL